MSTRKSVKARAPYNSQTFNTNNAKLVGQNGVLMGGLVTTSGFTVTVQPLSFIQNGLITSCDQPLSATLPATITAPYFLAVTTSSSIENLAEVITPTFVKRPEDVSANSVLVAEWDGQEWRQLPLLSSGAIARGLNDRSVAENLVGISSGFDITQDATNIYTTPGSAVCTDGSLITKKFAATLPKVPVDANALDRIDEVVLRRPQDDPARIATLKYVVGPTFNAGGTVQLFSAQTVNSTANQAAMVLNSLTTDALYIVVLDGTNLKYYTAPNATTVPSLVGTVATNVSSYTAILTPDGNIDLMYVNGITLRYQRLSVLGAVIYAESTIYTAANPIQNPKMVTVASGSSYFIHAVFEKFLSGSNWQLGYIRLSAANTVETPVQVLVDLSAGLHNPSLAKDDDDSTFYLAFENSDTQSVYLRTYDAGTATASAPPTQIGLPITLQDNTYNLSTASVLSSTGATNPMVRRTNNKETYVFWRHNKGSGNYGVAVWNANYLNVFGYKALVKDLYGVNENVDQYYVSVDGLNVAHFLLREQAAGNAANLRLTDLAVSEAQQVVATNCSDVYTRFNSRGSLVHSYGLSTPGCKIVKSTAGLGTTLRDRFLPPTDVYMAHYRTSDGMLSVAGTAIEEDPTIRRLYEFGNLFAATGSCTWGGTATHQLVINAPLTIHGFNRRSTYTIPANGPGGVNIPDGSICYVNLPDADVPSNLTLKVLPFGQGTLDRYGRTAIPLFWSIAGVLYTKFAPFRMEAGGDTIVIGQSLTDNERAFLGMPLEPDPNNHGYSSAVHITQNMSHNDAIGALDAAITGGGGGSVPTYFEGAYVLSAGQTSQVCEFVAPPESTANYRVVARLENTIDANPRFQTVVVTRKTIDGFVATWPVALDSDSYVLTFFGIMSDNFSGSVALTIGGISQSIPLPVAQINNTYRVVGMMENLVDANPQYHPFVVIGKSTTAFTLQWPDSLDSSNYTFNFVLVGSGGDSSLTGLTAGTTSQTVTFGTPRISADYAVFADFQNFSDSAPQMQPTVVTNKTANGFTVKWNAPLDTNNFTLNTLIQQLDLDAVQNQQIAQNTRSITTLNAQVSTLSSQVASSSGQLGALYDAIVGSAAQVSSGAATHSNLNTALGAVAAGATVFVLKTYVPTATAISLTQQVNILGQGHATTLSTGTFTITSGVHYCSLDLVRFGGSLTVGSNGNHIRGWQATGNTITNSGTDNAIVVVQE